MRKDEIIATKGLAYYKDYRCRRLETWRKWYAKKDYAYKHRFQRLQHLRQDYGITPEEYDKIVEEQKGLCAICGKSPLQYKAERALHIDHDHVTGKIRGLLCIICNRQLGWYEKYEEEINKYLRRK